MRQELIDKADSVFQHIAIHRSALPLCWATCKNPSLSYMVMRRRFSCDSVASAKTSDVAGSWVYYSLFVDGPDDQGSEGSWI
jgi:hypothetical protein